MSHIFFSFEQGRDAELLPFPTYSFFLRLCSIHPTYKNFSIENLLHKSDIQQVFIDLVKYGNDMRISIVDAKEKKESQGDFSPVDAHEFKNPHVGFSEILGWNLNQAFLKMEKDGELHALYKNSKKEFNCLKKRNETRLEELDREIELDKQHLSH